MGYRLSSLHYTSRYGTDPEMKPSLSVIIPVYNHGRSLHGVVKNARNLGIPLIVVDDGSTDNGHLTISDQPGMRLLRHEANRGKGEALLTGFRAAFADGAQWAITIDADGQHNPDDAINLIAAISQSKLSDHPVRPIIVGCRRGMLDAGAPWTSRFGRGFSNFWIRASGGPSMRDTQSGFRIYPLPEVLDLSVKARRYQFELEVLVRAAWQGIDVIEVPIGVIYQPDDQRISHFRPFVDFMRNSSMFTRLIFQRIFGYGRGRVNPITS
jgi:glycosyltransferase involved in cell wall biosynthesis